jgi:hypothetical protein
MSSGMISLSFDSSAFALHRVISKATCLAAVDVVYTALIPIAYTVPLLAASFSSFLL